MAKLTDEQKAERATKRQMTNALKEEARAHPTRRSVESGARRGCISPVRRRRPATLAVAAVNLSSTTSAVGQARCTSRPTESRVRRRPGEVQGDASRLRGASLERARTPRPHCGYRCPPAPISPEQYENIERIFASSPRRKEELDIWKRTQTCGHIIEQSVQHTNQHPSFTTSWCPECEMTRGVVSSTKTAEAASRMAEAKRKCDDQVARAERELKMAEKAARDARKRLADPRSNS